MATDRDESLARQGWNHLQLQRPLAAWACWQKALRIEPDDKAARQALETFETLEELPAAARAVYRFLNPKDDARRKRWNERLQDRDLQHLENAADVFRSLANDDPADTDASLNLALCLAWQGKNAEAIGVLDRIVAMLAATESERAVDAWTLAEVLRFGAGAETLADEFRCVWTLEPPNLPSAEFFARWPNLIETEVPVDPLTGRTPLSEGKVFEWLDRPVLSIADGRAPAGSEIPRKLASVILAPGFLRLSSPDPTTFSALDDPIMAEVEAVLRPARREMIPLPISWADASLSTYSLPRGLGSQERDRLTRELVELHHENQWIQIPRHGLSGLTPLKASREAARGDLILQAKLLGVIRFREQLSSRASHQRIYQGYPFDRLRRRLGLIGPDSNPAALDPADIGCMSESELDALELKSLEDHRLAEAVESSAPFLDDDRTARFAKALLEHGSELVKRIPPESLVAPRIRLAIGAGDPELAVRLVDQASDLYEGRFRQTVLIWKAEILAQAKLGERAFEIYRALMETEPNRAALAADGAETLRAHGYQELAAELLSS